MTNRCRYSVSGSLVKRLDTHACPCAFVAPVWQALWDHSGGQRKQKGVAFPAAPDWYRETVYRRTLHPPSFEVVHSWIPEGGGDAAAELVSDQHNRENPQSDPMAAPALPSQ